ncbi:hypothetical protein [Ulvibacterium sp.]|uniref:hypothetical protein n=1 Tax=Ulvibacterium sp. TaxID=2665914 RepID=UPI0026279FAC|nr:hypothetical protein [Ulvibacterium sp.]
MARQGKYAAYQQLRAPEDNISRDIQYWNQDNLIRQEEQRQQEQFQFRQDQAAQDRKQKLYDKYVKPLNNFQTASQSLNEVKGRLLQSAVEEYVPLMEIIENPKSSREDVLKAQLRLQNINNLPENLKTFTDFYTNQHNSYLKGVTEGTIYKNEEYEKAFAKGFENIQLGLDEQGLPVVAFVDRDGDGLADDPQGALLDFQTFDQTQRAIPSFDFQRKFDFEGYIRDVAENLAMKEEKIENGVVTTHTKGANLEALDLVTDRLFNLPGRTEAALRDYNLEGTDENMSKIKDDFKKSVLALIDTKITKEIDHTAINQARDDARAAKKDGLKRPRLSEPVTPTNDIWDFAATNIDPDKVNAIGVQGVTLPTVRARDGKTYSNAKVRSYTYNENGEMVLDVVVAKTKTITKTDYGELEERADSGDEEAKKELLQAQLLGTGGAKVTIPGTNERVSVIVSREDEAFIHRELGQTIEEGRSRAYKNEAPRETKKRTIEGF